MYPGRQEHVKFPSVVLVHVPPLRHNGVPDCWVAQGLYNPRYYYNTTTTTLLLLLHLTGIVQLAVLLQYYYYTTITTTTILLQ